MLVAGHGQPPAVLALDYGKATGRRVGVAVGSVGLVGGGGVGAGGWLCEQLSNKQMNSKQTNETHR